MASFSKQFAGRKRGSSVWTYFKYEEKEKKSRCIVIAPDGSVCSTMVATKNPTNLKSHLQKHHKAVYDEMIELENEQKIQLFASKQAKATG